MSAHTILVVEDNPITRKMLRLALESEGYAALEAGDGRSAIAVAGGMPLDLVLQDYVLPDMDGLQLLEQIRRLRSVQSLPAVVVTGLGSRIDELRARAGPWTEFLLKPVEPSRLVEVVKGMLARLVPSVGSGRRVLLVDDDPLQRKLGTLRLEQAGFAVEAASSGSEALALARAAPPDAVFSDVLMPGMDGFELTVALRRDGALASVPVVLVSAAYAEAEDRRLAAAVGANALVLRSPDLSEAIGTLAAALKAPPIEAVITRDITPLHRDRIKRQLEREAARSDTLLRQAAIQAAALSVVRSLAEVAGRPRAAPAVLGDILVHCLDAAGLSAGLLYLREDGEELRLQAQAGLPPDSRAAAERVFDLPEILRRAVRSSEPLGLRAEMPAGEEEGAALVARLGLSSALVVPLRSSDEAQGVLVLGSDSQDLSDPSWTAFARTLGGQFAETIALARALVRQTVWEERYRLLVEQATDAILILDRNQVVLEANQQAEGLLGRVGSEIVGRPFDEFVVPEEVEESRSRRQELLEQEHVRVDLRHLARPDGQRVATSISASLVRVGETALLLAILRDITPRHRAEQRLLAHHLATRAVAGSATLREASARVLPVLAQALEWHEAAVWTVDREDGVLRCGELWTSPTVSIPGFEAETRLARYAPGEGVPGRVWASGEPLWIEDVAREPGAEMPRGTSAAREGLRSICALPVRVQGEVVAVVEFASTDRRERDSATLDMLADVGAQLDQLARRRRAETALEAATQRLRHVVTANPAVLFLLRPVPDLAAGPLSLTWISENVDRLLGYSPDEALQPGWWADRLHPEERERVFAEVATLFEAGHLAHEYPFRNRRDEYRWIRAELRLLTDAEGSPLEVIGSWSDVTPRKEAELRLAQSEEQYRLLFETNPHPMWVFDLETLRFLAANDAAVRHYGYTREAFLGMTIEDIRPPEDVPALLEDMARVRAEEATALRPARLWRHRKRDGTSIDVEVTASPIVFEGRRARLILAHDVTEQKALEVQFLQSQKMESVGRLAGGVAHDFNNLLGVITGYTELLRRRVSRDERLLKYSDDILKASQRAADLTRQLLAFSRKQVLQPRILGLGEIVADTEKMLRRVIGEDVQLRTSIAEDLEAVLADRGQVEQVLMNLAVNARDAMPHGGHLTIGAANAELDEAYTRTRPEAVPGPYVMLSVTDSGEGMSEETQARIFEPFFTTKEPGKGTGLGLATVYGIVKQSGGHVFVYSEPGRGTSFKVYLPRAERRPAEEAAPVVAPPSLGTETVLLVEDEGALRELVHECLVAFGYAVLEAGSPAVALELAERHDGPIHLLVTDVVMPGMGGAELARRVTALRPGAKVLFVSGYTDDAVVREGVAADSLTFLQKPFTADALARKVRELLDPS